MNYSAYKNEMSKDDRYHKLDFMHDGRVHYIYRVTDLENKDHYYGSRTSKCTIIEEVIIALKAYYPEHFI